jgi:hypothetical protein
MPDLYEIGALGAFLGLVGWALADGIDFAPHPTAALKGGGGCVGASDPSTALDVANKWGPPFGCPVRTLLVIASIESGYRAQCSELSPRAMALGGAFGMWQQTRNTAAGHARALASSPDPDVQATLRKWTGRGPDLFDPDLCGMFAARQLGQATAEFGDDLGRVAGAYHQGAGKIRTMVAAGQAIPDQLPPHGKTYVTRALAAATQIG